MRTMAQIGRPAYWRPAAPAGIPPRVSRAGIPPAVTRTMTLLLVALAAIAPTAADAAAFDPDVVTRGTLVRDHYTAGGSVDVDAEVLGDLVAAGAYVTVAGRIAGDLLAAGGDLDLRAAVDDDARLAAARMHVDAPVRDHLVAAAGSITLGPQTTVGGHAWLAGHDVSVAGRVRGPVRVLAETVTLDGRIDGPVEVTAATLRIGPDARIGGDLHYRARSPATIAEGARIDGRVRFDERARGERTDTPAVDHGLSAGGLVLFVVALTLAGGVLHALFPGFTRAAAGHARSEPLLSLGVGALVALVAPIALVGLCLFVVTIPLALAGLALLPPMLLGGYLVFAFFLAERGAAWLRLPAAQDGWRRLAALAGALLALGLLQELPWVGTLVLLAALLVGTGAGAVAIGRRYRAAA